MAEASIGIPLGNQVFDLAFHPEADVVFAGLLTGEIRAFSYDNDGSYEEKFKIRPTKRSCRGLATNIDGARLFSVTKDKTLHSIDTGTGGVIQTKVDAHENPINRVVSLMPHMVGTGDDEGVIKLWDTRTVEEVREYKHHFDFISDFLWLEDKKHLVATSGDGTLSVIDVRGKKVEPFAHSEDQEDELLSVVGIKGSSKLVVGTQLGLLSVFDRKRGYADCVDRIPGHPQSVDAMVPITDNVIATGSSDGLIRMVQIHPTKFLGVVADHGEFPVERLKVDRNGRWLGSASHDEILKLTDIENALEESDGEARDEDAEDEDVASGSEEADDVTEGAEDAPDAQAEPEDGPLERTGRPLDDSSDSEAEQPAKKRMKKKKKKGGGGQAAGSSFFSGL